MNPKVKDAMCSSKNLNEQTPPSLFKFLNDTYGPFTLDAAASVDNKLCKNFITAEEDALMLGWPGTVWCNPPYGRGLPKWVDKFAEEAGPLGLARRIVALVPSRTDTRWFQCGIVGHAQDILFYRGRIKFSGHKQGALFPSAIVVYDAAIAMHRTETGKPPVRYGQLIPIRTDPYYTIHF